MSTAFTIFFFLGWIGAMAWLFLKRRFTRRLHELHPQVYDSLGRPPLGFRRRYGMSELSGAFSVLHYLIAGRYRGLGDEAFVRFADKLRALFFIEILLIVAIFTMGWIEISETPCGQAESNPAATSLVYLNQAYAHYHAGRFEAGLSVLNDGLAQDPDAPGEAYYCRGIIHEKINRYDRAIADFEKAIKLDPNHFDSYLHIDWLYAQQRKWDTILALWTRFLELNPSHAGAYLERGGTYYRKGDLIGALADAGRACELGSSEGCRRYEQVRNRLRVQG
jgi:tetratricopeptide (TPR) repeat protein